MHYIVSLPNQLYSQSLAIHEDPRAKIERERERGMERKREGVEEGGGQTFVSFGGKLYTPKKKGKLMFRVTKKYLL